MSFRLVVDWDGTATQRDTQWMLVERARLRPASTTSSRCSGVCGEACRRGSLPPGPIVYVGDGYSDRSAAQAADRIFARDGLGEFLAARGVAFERFDDLHDVAAALSRPV